MKIGKLIQQPSGYQAFIPDKFPPKEQIVLNSKTQQLHAKAVLMLGKLDGITQLLPDLDFFIFMYIRKEAAKSSEIEGTQATIIDVIKSEAQIESRFPQDVERIIHYINAMEYGLNRLETLPLSLRFIREIHKVLIGGTIDAPGKTPGEFRTSQNWIGGGSPNTAKFVPPTHAEMNRCLDDFEKFLHATNEYPPLIKAALAHAQFETIHPFLDGNGRTGRLLTTFYLCKLGILERPVLYLSEYFLNNQKAYYGSLNSYHQEDADVFGWLDFFLDGVAIIATEAIEASKKINILRQKDTIKIQSLGRRTKTGMIVLENLFKLPIISVRKVEEWTGLSRPQANDLVKKLIELGILEQRNKNIKYDREFWYKKYLDVFVSKEEIKKSNE
ncbi:Fic family protein [Patescibacteria group bacterium]|nr:Fic family protein [Patescibacteria group bacterium]MCL5010014.1 Fic family protein [Patescibacteria group bacterium]